VVFLQNSLRNLAGNFRAEFDPEQGIRIPGQGIWRLGNPNPARLCGVLANIPVAFSAIMPRDDIWPEVIRAWPA
jgi:hypothetical protein